MVLSQTPSNVTHIRQQAYAFGHLVRFLRSHQPSEYLRSREGVWETLRSAYHFPPVPQLATGVNSEPHRAIWFPQFFEGIVSPIDPVLQGQLFSCDESSLLMPDDAIFPQDFAEQPAFPKREARKAT